MYQESGFSTPKSPTEKMYLNVYVHAQLYNTEVCYKNVSCSSLTKHFLYIQRYTLYTISIKKYIMYIERFFIKFKQEIAKNNCH